MLCAEEPFGDLVRIVGSKRFVIIDVAIIKQGEDLVPNVFLRGGGVAEIKVILSNEGVELFFISVDHHVDGSGEKQIQVVDMLLVFQVDLCFSPRYCICR